MVTPQSSWDRGCGTNSCAALCGRTRRAQGWCLKWPEQNQTDLRGEGHLLLISQLLIYNLQGHIQNSNKDAVGAAYLSGALLAPRSPLVSSIQHHKGGRIQRKLETQEWSQWQVSAATVTYPSLLPEPLTAVQLPLPCLAGGISPNRPQEPGLGALLPTMWLYNAHLLCIINCGSFMLRFSCVPIGITSLCLFLEDAARLYLLMFVRFLLILQ